MQQRSVTIPASTPAAPEGAEAAALARYEAGQAAAAAGVTYAPPTEPAAVVPPSVPAVVPPAAPATPPVVPPVVPPAEAPATTSFVDNLLATSGLTREALAGEFQAGGLKPESYAALAKQGIDKATVDQYFAGIQSQTDSANAAYETAVITATVGSPEKYAEVVNWASKGLTPAEQQTFNAAVTSGDQARAAFAVAGLNARYLAANPAEPVLFNQQVPSGGVTAFASWAQVKAEMSKPEYKNDPAFRETVRNRLAVSPL